MTEGDVRWDKGKRSLATFVTAFGATNVNSCGSRNWTTRNWHTETKHPRAGVQNSLAIVTENTLSVSTLNLTSEMQRHILPTFPIHKSLKENFSCSNFDTDALPLASHAYNMQTSCIRRCSAGSHLFLGLFCSTGNGMTPPPLTFYAFGNINFVYGWVSNQMTSGHL